MFSRPISTQIAWALDKNGLLMSFVVTVRSNKSLLILVDLSASFDTIDYSILLERLAVMGIGALSFGSYPYLTSQFQKVVFF